MQTLDDFAHYRALGSYTQEALCTQWAEGKEEGPHVSLATTLQENHPVTEGERFT